MLQIFTSTFWKALSQDLTENPYTTYAQEIKTLSYGQELSDFSVNSILDNFNYQLLFNSEQEFRADQERIRIYLKKFPYLEALNYSRAESQSLLNDSFYRFNQLIAEEFESRNFNSTLPRQTISTDTQFNQTRPTLEIENQFSNSDQNLNLTEESINDPVSPQQNPNQESLETLKLNLEGTDNNIEESEEELAIQYEKQTNFELPVGSKLIQPSENNFSIQNAKAALQTSQQERQRRLQVNQVMNQQQSQQQLSNFEKTLQATRQNSATIRRTKSSTTSKILKGLAVTGTVGTGAAVSGFTLFQTIFF